MSPSTLTSPTLFYADEEELQQSRYIVESTKVLLKEGKSDDSTDEEEILYEQTQLWNTICIKL